MRLYRVATERFARDISGYGALLSGGRWNPKGLAVVYTSDHPAIAFQEVFAGIPIPDLPQKLKLVTIELPDTMSIRVVTNAELPYNWDAMPPQVSTIGIGEEWYREGKSSILRVPPTSVPLGFGYNFILNPVHPEVQKAQIDVNINDWAVGYSHRRTG